MHKNSKKNHFNQTLQPLLGWITEEGRENSQECRPKWRECPISLSPQALYTSYNLWDLLYHIAKCLTLIGSSTQCQPLIGPLVQFIMVFLKISHISRGLHWKLHSGMKTEQVQRPRRNSHSGVAFSHAKTYRDSRLQRPWRLASLGRCMFPRPTM